MSAIRNLAPSQSAVPPARSDALLYVYCVLEPGTPAQELLRSGHLPSLLAEAPVFAIEAAGLVAAVSRVPAASFDEAPLNALLTNLDALTPYAVRHEAVIRALAEASPSLIPIGFGAVYRDTASVAGFLTERADDLGLLLERLRGRQEWGLKIFRDNDRFAQAVQATSPALQQLAADLAAAGPGRAYLLHKRRDRLFAEEYARLAAGSLDEAVTRLAAWSDAVQREPPVPETALASRPEPESGRAG